MKHKWIKNDDGTVNEWAWVSGHHNGPVCEVCGASPCIHCTHDYDAEECPGELEHQPMTRADHIRAMSDEELAAFLIDVDIDGATLPFTNNWLDWLRQPWEGDAT